MGGRFKREGIYVCLWLIHIVIQLKPTQYCEAIILRFKRNWGGKKVESERMISMFMDQVTG